MFHLFMRKALAGRQVLILISFQALEKDQVRVISDRREDEADKKINASWLSCWDFCIENEKRKEGEGKASEWFYHAIINSVKF